MSGRRRTSVGDRERADLTVVIPTFNNEGILAQTLESWRTHANSINVEIVVVEDGCRDGTTALLERTATWNWDRARFRWIHMDDAHELRCTNAGFAAATGALLMAWQDDMFLQARWLVHELIDVFARHRDVGLLGLSRGLDMFPVPDPIERWEDLIDWRRLRSTIGPFLWNWVRLQEVDSIIRPWVIRHECLQRVGSLDEAFVPTEWDEADLAFRVRAAGWKVATCGYERLGGYFHVGSSTLGTLSDAYKARVLRNGRLFHERWDTEIERSHARPRSTWARPMTLERWATTGLQALRAVPRRLAERRMLEVVSKPSTTVANERASEATRPSLALSDFERGATARQGSARDDASERSEASHENGAGRRSGSRESVSGSPSGEAPRRD